MKDKMSYIYSLYPAPQIQVLHTHSLWNLGCSSGFKFTVTKQRLQQKLQWPPGVLSKCFCRHMKQDQSQSTQQAGGCRWKKKSKNKKFLLSFWETRKDHELPEAQLQLSAYGRDNTGVCLHTVILDRRVVEKDLYNLHETKNERQILVRWENPISVSDFKDIKGFLCKDQIVWGTNYSILQDTLREIYTIL